MAAYDNLLANVPTDLWIGGQGEKASAASAKPGQSALSNNREQAHEHQAFIRTAEMA
jgi:hypothetical protein